eukprot:CAMPEP_0177732548 /NCGR_PEP_ID=MMETSP0484_2-20121128/23177_1 /TAXON_ID=354590 /ORGANISM="Rhodomonas lens, Strain RHODO" /LENGTH=168 /DNA_ID=CAMNT_0019245803 /DNA_START=44 /DNA_END=550 /DNA_ORIENTATION=-
MPGPPHMPPGATALPPAARPPQHPAGGPPPSAGAPPSAANPQPPPKLELIKEHESKRKKPFAMDLKRMMYGFGDMEQPLPETVEVMDDIVCEFISRLTEQVVVLSEKRGKKGKLATEDVLFLVRKHPKMYYRAKELIRLDKEIKRASKITNDAIDGLGKAPPGGGSSA